MEATRYTSNRKHTMTDHDITEIADARYIGLMCPPASPEAKSLVNDIINIIEQAEQRQRVRKAKDNAAFRSAVGLITGDLLIAMEAKEHRWSYHGLSPAAFDDRPVGYKTFKPIVETMEAVGLISISKGRNAQAPQFDEGAAPSYHPSLATRFRPTRDYDPDLWRYGIRSSDLERWLPEERKRLELMVGTGQIDETNEDYLLVNGVSCLSIVSLEDDPAKYFMQKANEPLSPLLPGVLPILPRGDRGDYVPLD